MALLVLYQIGNFIFLFEFLKNFPKFFFICGGAKNEILTAFCMVEIFCNGNLWKQWVMMNSWKSYSSTNISITKLRRASTTRISLVSFVFLKFLDQSLNCSCKDSNNGCNIDSRSPRLIQNYNLSTSFIWNWHGLQIL